MAGKEGFDGCFEVGDALEDAAPDGFFAQFPKPAFDQIGPRGAGRREVQRETGMFFQPPFDLGMLMGAVVIQDQMEAEGSSDNWHPRCAEISETLDAGGGEDIGQ